MSLPSTVQIGGMSKQELVEAMTAQGVRINSLGMKLFQDARFSASPDREIVPIVGVRVADLGFAAGATYEDIVRAAAREHLIECPLELGPHLRLAYPDQPEGSSGAAAMENRAPPGALTVASAALDDSESTPRGFYLRRIEGVLWLRAYTSWAGHVWDANDVLVFRRS